jgi:hypothetical protein
MDDIQLIWPGPRVDLVRRTPLMLADARDPSAIRPRVLAGAAPRRTPVAATRAQTKDRIVLQTRSLKLKGCRWVFDAISGLPD